MSVYRIIREDGLTRETHDREEFTDLLQLLDEHNREYDTEVPDDE